MYHNRDFAALDPSGPTPVDLPAGAPSGRPVDSPVSAAVVRRVVRENLDRDFYLARYPDVAEHGMDPVEHYIVYGHAEGRDPAAGFSTAAYLADHPDVAAAGINAFAHYLTVGGQEGRRVRPSTAGAPGPSGNGALEWAIDQFDADAVTGWVWAPASPTRRLLLQLFVDGRDEGLFDAYGFRADLAAAKKGDGHCAFSIPLARHIAPGAGTEIRLVARGCGSVLLHERLSVNRDRLLAESRLVGAEPARPGASLFLGAPLAAEADARAPAAAREPGPAVAAIDHAGVEAYSFDVWDTLLRRDCAPDEIKLQSARFLWLAAGNAIRPAFRDTVSLYRARMIAENGSAPEDNFEYRFETAVRRWLHDVLTPGLSVQRIAELAERIAAHELAAEIGCTRVDPGIPPLLAAIRQPTVFVSDFYMGARFIHALLEHHDLDRHFIRGYASSDIFETKRDGRLLTRVANDLAVPPSAILHVGDSDSADVEMPARLGIRSLHYLDAGELRRRDWFEEAHRAFVRGDLGLHERRLCAIADEAAAAFGTGDESLEAIGARFAPVLLGYVLAILEDGLQHDVATISFFTREGQLFEAVYRALVEADVYTCGRYPASQLVEVSRRATFAASLGELNADTLMRLWTLYSRQSVKGLARSLNLDDAVVAPIAREHGLDYDETVTYPWQDSRVLALLDAPAFREHATARLAEQRDGLTGYLAERGLTAPGLHLVADIGWRGTIHDNLAHLLPHGFVRGHYLGLYRYLNRQPANVEKRGFLFDDNRDQPLELSDVGPIEMVCNGAGGSVTGYRRGDDGRIEAIREVIDEEEALVRSEVDAFQRGLLGAIPALAGYVRRHGLTAAALRPLGCALLQATLRQPPASLAAAFNKLHHNETFGTGGVDVTGGRLALPAPGTAEGAAIHRAARALLADSRWPEAAVRAPEVRDWFAAADPAERLAMPQAFTAAHVPAVIRARNSRCSIFVPPPIRGSGGHRTIFNVVRGLARIGIAPEIFLEGDGAGVDCVEEYLGGTRAVIHRRWLNYIPTDFALATVSYSAPFVTDVNAHRRGYLVQDFESLFNPMSDMFLLGEDSYSLGLNHLTVGNWLTHRLRHDFDARTLPAGLGTDHTTYRRDPAIGRERAVCFLYQPDKPRRAPQLGIQALRLVKQALPDTRIYVYGSDLPIHLDFEVENLGLVHDLGTLNALYNRCTAGLCISGSNPSRIPYEMMAAGCVPVDLYRYNNLMDHSADGILLAYQDPASIAEGLIRVLTGAAGAPTGDSASAWVASRSLSWETDVITNGIAALLDGEALPETPVAMTYHAAPVIAPASRRAGTERFCEAERLLALR